MDNLDHSFLTLNRTSLSERRSTKIIFTKKLFIRYSPYGMVQKFVLLKFSNWRAAWFFLLDVTPNVRIEQFDSSQWTPRKLSSSQKNSSSEKVHVELFLETRSMLETKSGEFFVGTGPSLSGNHGLGFVLIHTDPWIYDQGYYFFILFHKLYLTCILHVKTQFSALLHSSCTVC